MQARRLHHAHANFGMRGAEAGKCQAAQLEPCVQAEGEQHQRARGFQARGRFGDAAEAGAHLRQEGLAGRRQNELFVQPLEQAHAHALFERLHLLADRAGVTRSSCAASLKLRCRAAASKARSALSGGRM
jgi:hypothetical protein